MRWNLSFWGCLVMVLGSVTVGKAEAEQNAAEMVEEFHAALADRDRDGALAALAPNALIFESGGAELSRAEYEGHHLDADMEFAAATTRSVIDQQSGHDGSIAWLLTRSTTTGTFRDQEIDALGVETMLLRKSDEGWRIFHIHWSSRPR